MSVHFYNTVRADQVRDILSLGLNTGDRPLCDVMSESEVTLNYLNTTIEYNPLYVECLCLRYLALYEVSIMIGCIPATNIRTFEILLFPAAFLLDLTNVQPT